jgi:hypothetical protein
MPPAPSRRPSNAASRPPGGPLALCRRRPRPGPGGSLGAPSSADHGGGSRELTPPTLPAPTPATSPCSYVGVLCPAGPPTVPVACGPPLQCRRRRCPLHGCAGTDQRLYASLRQSASYTVAPAIGRRRPRACTEHTTGQVADCGPTEEMKRGKLVFLAPALAFCSRDRVFRLLLV